MSARRDRGAILRSCECERHPRAHVHINEIRMKDGEVDKPSGGEWNRLPPSEDNDIRRFN